MLLLRGDAMLTVLHAARALLFALRAMPPPPLPSFELMPSRMPPATPARYAMMLLMMREC